MVTRLGPHPDDERAMVLADAAGALAVHVDDGGFCRGCILMRGRLVTCPCTRVRWALAVQASLAEDHGAPREHAAARP